MVLQRFLANQRGATAAEFALLLPIIMLFMFGIIDAGRFAWEFNKGEKATQMGARWAVVTNMIPSDLITYSFAVDEPAPIPQGTVVPKANFPGVVCAMSGGALACTCKSGGTCSFSLTPGSVGIAAFDAIVGRMQDIKPDINENDVEVDYDWSGIGFSGDPNGPDVAPLVTVKLKNQSFHPLTLFLFGTDLGMPEFDYTLSMEDGQGTESN